MNIGKLDLCLKVKDLGKSVEFYEKLGFARETADLEHGYCALSGQGYKIALYTDAHIGENMLNFRGGDVFKIAETLKGSGFKFESEATVERDGSAGATLRDPDGNLIYFNTSPKEAQAQQ